MVSSTDMVSSADYDVNLKEAFMSANSDLLEIIDNDTVIKTVRVMIKFQVQQQSLLWGKTFNDKTALIERSYIIVPHSVPSDAALLAVLKVNFEKSNNPLLSQVALFKEALDLICDIDLEKYPTLLNTLCQLIRKMDDKSLLMLFLLHQKITASVSDSSLEKLVADVLSDAQLNSAMAQELLLSLRQKLNADTPLDLFYQARTYLQSIAPSIIQFLEKEAEIAKEKQETFLLPLESEKVQQLIAPLRNKILNERLKIEMAKLGTCYNQAISEMKVRSGEKRLTSIDIKIVYAKRSNLKEDFVYEKKFF